MHGRRVNMLTNSLLPDDYALCFGTEHLIAFFDVEGLEEGSDVAESDVHAVLAERVNVACRERTHFFGANIVGPKVSIVHIEHLQRIIAVDLGFL